MRESPAADEVPFCQEPRYNSSCLKREGMLRALTSVLYSPPQSSTNQQTAVTQSKG